jgi:glycosyltransferase involved in cell wall biosynthesis
MAIVVSNGGSDQMVSDGETGFLVKDFEDVKTKLTKLMSSGSTVYREFQGQKARTLAKTKAGLENVSRQYADIYKEFGSDKLDGK